MERSFLHRLTDRELPAHCGRKAEQIQKLLSYSNICVPDTHICTWDAYESWLIDEEQTMAHLRQELNRKLDLSQPFAVRSSANLEDGIRTSFAGQFNSYLNRKGCDSLLEAIRQVWESTQSVDLMAYLRRTDTPADQLRMAVILQEMIEPVVSGVSFNKNPVTGLDEIVVEAVTGTGEALVQEGVTPDRWVYKWGTWIDKPDATEIDERLIKRVVEETTIIAAASEGAVDLEWVHNGQDIFWIQLRGITAIDRHNIYSNRISREVLPGMIKPLVWSTNTQIVNSAWIDLFSELIGPNDIRPEDLAKSFYYRAYFNMGTIGEIFVALGMPRNLLEILMGIQGGDQQPKFRPSKKVMRHIPRIARFILSKIRFSKDIDTFLLEMDQQYARFAGVDLAQLTNGEILKQVDDLLSFTERAAYRNIVVPLLMQAYNYLLRLRLEKSGVDYDSLDLMCDFAELGQYDPNPYLEELSQSFSTLDVSQQNLIKSGTYADLREMASVREFRDGMVDFLNRFGHLSDSGNDFSAIPWREDPDLVLQMVIKRADAVKMGKSSSQSDDEGSGKVVWRDLPLGSFKRLPMNWLYRRARQFRFYREATSFKYTYGYGLLRNYFLALGERFVMARIMVDSEDIFMLSLSEIKSLVQGDSALNIPAVIEARRKEMQAVEDILLPEIIYGDEAPPLEVYDNNRHVLSGIPTSGGYFKGPIRVINSLADMEKMIAGAVLVIPYSDVSWVPLFAQAGAIIAESGGMLSHSSIVAREYQLPAVVSLANACNLLQDDMLVTVDGFKGEVIID